MIGVNPVPRHCRRRVTDGSIGTPEIDRGHRGVTVTCLRQAGFLVAGEGGSVLLDPFLTDLPGMLVAPPVAPESVADVTAVLASHEHIDHLDGPAWSRIAAASAKPVFIVPQPVRGVAIAAGIPAERVIGARVGTTIELGATVIEPVPACHGVNMTDAYSFGTEWSGGDHRYLGYVVRLAGVTIYHAGDTVMYEGIADRLRALAVDLAFLPINGRDAFREQANIVGNLDAREAAELAGSIGVDLAIPMHFGTVPDNTGSPGVFVENLRRARPRVSTLVPSLGDTFFYGGRQPKTPVPSTTGGDR